MKLLKIELKNYRQYNGVQEIEFSTSIEKDITVLVGSNGAGKTNFLNGILWCLYGEEAYLSKYPETEKLPIINSVLLSELKEGEMTECRIKIILGTEQPEYIVERTAHIRKVGQGYRIVDTTFTVNESTDRGWVEVPDPSFVVNNNLLPKKVKDYFFFDGERLDTFFKTGRNDLVKDAVLDVAQIGLIDKAFTHLDASRSELEEYAKQMCPQTTDIVDKIRVHKKSLDTFREEKTTNEGEKRKAIKAIEEMNVVLRDYPIPLIRELQRQRESLEKETKIMQAEINSKTEENKNRILSEAPLLFAQQAISKTLYLIDKEIAEGRHPPPIDDSYIKGLLEKELCICKTQLTKGTLARKEVESLLSTIFPDSKYIADEAKNCRYRLLDFMKQIDNFRLKSIEYENQLTAFNRELETRNLKLREISEKISKHDIQEMEVLESNRNQLDAALKDLEKASTLLDDRIGRLDSLLSELETKLRKELRKEDRAKIYSAGIQFCDGCLNALSMIKDELVDEIRKTIETKTEEYFLNLIWKKKAYANVKIDHDYNISVINAQGMQSLGSLSSGERQILALSFMAALYEVSGFDMPIIIDTPLGRISEEPRENIARCLPTYLKNTQLTLLVTDTEYTENVKQFICDRVGIEYTLEYDEAGTKISNSSMER